jgi:cobalt transporter subunit CbtA
MIARTLLAALVAGLIAGVFMTLAQQYRTVPLILHAEQYEAGHDHAARPQSLLPALAEAVNPLAPAHAHDHGAEAEGSGMLFGLDRFGGTLFANLVIGAGFGLILTAVSLMTGQAITAANGVLWGAAGWLAVHLLPAIGLPPELPGFPAAELAARQTWWSVTVVLSAIGLYLVGLRPETWAKVGGVVLIAVPHIIGAPYPDDITSNVPALLAAEFAVAALATGLFFWIVLGLALGLINDRLERSGA